MTIFHAIVLGIVQGVTEFLPISSSGFLILIPEFLGWEVQSLAFDAFLHIATLTAVIAALWPEVKAMVGAFFVPVKDQANLAWRRLALWILYATIPVMGIGFFVQNVLEFEFRSSKVVAWSFIVWGIVLYIADRRAKVSSVPTQEIGLKRALLIGCAQVVALIPGTSRSGITITAGLMSGLSRETAARFSFLLAIPTIAAAGFLKLGTVASGEETIAVLPLIVGFSVACVSAFLTLRFLLVFLKRYSFSEFAIFRVVVGIVILLLS
ncbi:undecaprenyl-diphosphate phosphatase [Candidatus Uhrbacteria bacterium]|nr:undecaprenyl-diphosphate phosphatase [Candidatus Uhrbacteria bacterium]